jgi:N-acetylglucosaminyl-diphospho-decaprenol L-rhamnosyltransferase
VLLVSYNTRDLLLDAIASVEHEPGAEVVVVDNASHDGSADVVAARFPHVRLVRSDSNLGFAGGINRAASEASGRSLLVLNPDAYLESGALNQLLEWLETHPKAALVGPSLRYPDGRRQSAAFAFPDLVQTALDLFPVNRLMESRINGRLNGATPHQVDFALGACMLIRRQAWEDIGPLDTGYFMYVEEVDWCRRAKRRGWEIWQQPRAVAVHHGGAATRQQPDAMLAALWRSRLRYFERYADPVTNRLLRRIVNAGLAHRSSPDVDRVRQLVR